MTEWRPNQSGLAETASSGKTLGLTGDGVKTRAQAHGGQVVLGVSGLSSQGWDIGENVRSY